VTPLAEFEKAGYRFRLHNGQVRVQGPQRLLDADHVHRLRQHKAEIQRELVLRNFVDLVRITAACDHHILLHRDHIRRELDEQSAEDLLTAMREQRQAWASAIASRLARRRIGNYSPTGDFENGNHD
jgi:hypothetical protein